MFGYGRYRETNGLLNGRFNEKGTLIAVHRAGWGGNIPPSSLDAFRAGLAMGGDMMEIDVSLDSEGTPWVFHDGSEPHFFGTRRNISTMSREEASSLRFLNAIGEETGKGLDTLDGLFAELDDDVLFNIDRCWKKLPEIDAVLERHPEKMRQALLKTHAEDDSLDFLADCERKYMYMSVVSSALEIDKVLSYGDAINLVGFELISPDRDSYMMSPELIGRLHGLGLFAWVNAISLGSHPRFRISGGLDDDLSIREGGDAGWGELLKRGFDVIQTDWPSLLSSYIHDR